MDRQFDTDNSIDNREFNDTIQTVCLSVIIEPGGGDTVSIEPVTDGELSILEVIWQQGTPTTRDIADATYDPVSDSKMATEQKLLERLESKGCVSRDRRERAHRFGALVSREDFLRHRLQGLADRLCDGAIVPLVTTLLRSKEGTFQKERANNCAGSSTSSGRKISDHRTTLHSRGIHVHFLGKSLPVMRLSPRFWRSRHAILLSRIWKNAAAIHVLWVVVLLKLFTPPLLTTAIPFAVTIVPSGANADSHERFWRLAAGNEALTSALSLSHGE